MIFRQIGYAPGGCASYVLGCPQAREAVVVDPLADVGLEEYLLELADRGLDLRWVIDTHLHADHRSLGPELAQATGCPYALHESARAVLRVPFQPLADGQVLALGSVALEVMHTPGHTPESMCLLVRDRGRSDEPWFVLTGDTLFVGDVGRPDLLLGQASLDVLDAGERAASLYDSIHGRLLALPDHVEVYPGHFGGSSCGGVHMSGKAASTIGYERRFNLALQQPDREAFAAFVRETLRPLPRNYREIKRANAGLTGGEPAPQAQ